MKRLYEEYLHVPEDGKIKEKVFIARIVVAIVCVVCCLSAMGFSAYAFFTSSITSGSNTIVAATYGAEAVITSSEGTTLTAKADNPLLYENVATGTYAVSLKALGTAKNGYCKIEIIGSEKTVTLFTQQLPPGENMSFTLVLNGGANITVTPQWGTYSNRDVVVGDKSTQEIQLVTEVDKDVTTPSTSSVSHSSGIDEKPTADLNTEQSTGEEKTQGSTTTSGEGTDNSESSDVLQNDSPDNQNVEETTSDSISDETGNGEN